MLIDLLNAYKEAVRTKNFEKQLNALSALNSVGVDKYTADILINEI